MEPLVLVTSLRIFVTLVLIGCYLGTRSTLKRVAKRAKLQEGAYTMFKCRVVTVFFFVLMCGKIKKILMLQGKQCPSFTRSTRRLVITQGRLVSSEFMLEAY